MGDVLTPNLGLIKPDVGGSDDMWGEKLNANFDKIDTAIAAGGGGDVTQVYVDAQDALRVLKAGDAMTGFLTLHADPITAFQAATKQYVDAHSGGGGGGIPEAPNDGTVYGRRNLAWTRAVAVAGDVMVGDLTIRKAFPTLWLDKPAAGAGEVSIYGTAATIAQWGLILGTGANNNFELRRHNAAGAYMTSPLVVDRLTGKTFITGNTGPALDVSVAPGTNTNFVATFRGDPTLNSACIEVKGTYSAYFGSIAGYPGMFKDAGVNGAYWYDTNNSFMGVAGHIAVCWPNGYINFAINSGGASGATGWGFRDNAGIVEAKHSGGAWAPVGDVTGPAAAVADRIAVFNGATGKLIKDGGITIAGLSAYVPSGNIAANTLAGAIAELDAEKVAKAGDTMTGHLTLPAGPAAANATRKDYVDAAAALKLAKAGDTMTGDLQFNAGFATTGITPASNPGLGNTTFGFNMRQDGYGPIIFYNRNNYGGIYIGQNIDGTLLSWTRSGATVGAIGVTTTSTSYGTSSDERLKEDLKSFNAGNIIDDTNVYNFAWKATGERSYGIIAQQANEIYPTAIIHDEEQDWWGVDYSKYVPVILQELKALRARVAELEMAAGIKPPTIDPKVKSAPKKKTKKVKKAKSKRGIRHG